MVESHDPSTANKRTSFKFSDPKGSCACGKHVNFEECQAAAIPDFLAKMREFDASRAARLRREQEAWIFDAIDKYLRELLIAVGIGLLVAAAIYHLLR
jgi:hypothetical protein